MKWRMKRALAMASAFVVSVFLSLMLSAGDSGSSAAKRMESQAAASLEGGRVRPEVQQSEEGSQTPAGDSGEQEEDTEEIIDMSHATCIFIETNGHLGNTVHRFRTFTAFAASTCSWKVWHFGSPHPKGREALEKLKSVENVEIRMFPDPAAAPQHLATLNISAALRGKYKLFKPDMDEDAEANLANLMLQHLRPTDYICLVLHDGAPHRVANMVRHLGEMGVAKWVDKWMFDCGPEESFTVPLQLSEALHAVVPDIDILQVPPPLKAKVVFGHRAAYIGSPRGFQLGAKRSIFWQRYEARRSTHPFDEAEARRKYVFIDMGTGDANCIYNFMSYIPDPQNWEAWGFEPVEAKYQDAARIVKWVESSFHLDRSPRDGSFQASSEGAPALTGIVTAQGVEFSHVHLLKSVVWTEDTRKSFALEPPPPGEADGKPKEYHAVDIARWFRTTVKKDDYVFVRMNLDWASYDVLEHLTKNGMIDWVDKWALELQDAARSTGFQQRLEHLKKNFLESVKATGAEVVGLEQE
mmetsp:Transcript_10163/g.22901  ORF Transcript_10163/g.22901 Transcript_10163/m.22901 type:complete len:525 (+) Transcript_10163:94-1668(+)